MSASFSPRESAFIDLQIERLDILREIGREQKLVREGQERINNLRLSLEPIEAELQEINRAVA